MSDYQVSEKRTAFTIVVTLYAMGNGRLDVRVDGVLHDRRNMLLVAAELRRAADLIEMRDAE